MDNSRLLGGRYDIKRHLQTGHVTVVYEGFDRQREQEVAIEVMRDVRGRDPAAAARFNAAGRDAAALRHPNIAEVQAAEETGGLAYIVREQPSGGSLDELVARDGRLPAADAATIALQISEGLTYAHRSGLVHGGLTPSLALLTEDRDVKLAGFGVAATVLTTDALDTRYAAPEQFQGAPGDATSDIYALGSCLYEMLLGLPPFAGDPQMLARIGPRVPPELGAILRQLLAADPGDRYQDAADVGTDLGRYLGIDVRDDAPPPRARAVDRPERSVRADAGDVGRRSLTRPVVVTAAVVSVIVLATATFTARKLTQGSEMVADTGGSSDGDVEIGADPQGTVGQSASGETPGSTSTSTESTTTDPSTTTTTDPAEDDEADEEDEDESPEDPGSGGPTTTPTTSPATTTPPTSPSTTAAPATVPNVVGMSENQASGTLAAQGLGMSTRRVNVSDSNLDGRVLSQSPGGGSPHPASGVVNVDVGRYCFLIC